MFKTLLTLGALGNLAIATSSLAIPFLLGWREELQTVRPLTRSLFWTYSGYAAATHFWFAAMSFFARADLASGSVLARFVTGFIAAYWFVRVIGQFAWYDRSVRGERLLYRVGEVCYVLLFAALTVIYGWVAVRA